MSQPVIRALGPGDGPALHGLLCDLAEETPWSVMSAAELRQAGPAAVRIPGDPAGGAVLVAWQGGRMIGVCILQRGAWSSNRHGAALSMGVRRAFWGQGVAPRLMRAALAWAREAGLRRLELGVARDNGRARSFYRRYGFVEEGCRRGALHLQGRDRDEILMALWTGPAATRR